jgi:hypothetical protein
VGPACQRLCRHVACPDWPSGAASPVSMRMGTKASHRQCCPRALFRPAPVSEVNRASLSEHRAATAVRTPPPSPWVSAAMPRPALKSTVVPHSLPPPRRVLRTVLPRLTPLFPRLQVAEPWPELSSAATLPSTTAPLVVYDLLVPLTLPRVSYR